MSLYNEIQECLAFIRARSTTKPKLGIILGTGLSSVAEDIVVEREFIYGLLPYFCTSTVDSHRGKLILGTLHGVPVVAMSGRLHYYEGYSMQQLAFPDAVKMLESGEHHVLHQVAYIALAEGHRRAVAQEGVVAVGVSRQEYGLFCGGHGCVK